MGMWPAGEIRRLAIDGIAVCCCWGAASRENRLKVAREVYGSLAVMPDRLIEVKLALHRSLQCLWRSHGSQQLPKADEAATNAIAGNSGDRILFVSSDRISRTQIAKGAIDRADQRLTIGRLQQRLV